MTTNNKTKKALLFGLNYVDTPEVALRGCHEDVRNITNLLRSKYGFEDIDAHFDGEPGARTDAAGILQEINDLAIEAHRRHLDLVWIHFSGHGTRVRDWNNDEKDGYDEAIVPSDYKTRGLVTDDYIKRVLRNFPSCTKVICVFDCCHSGSIADLKYRYTDPKTRIVENTSRACDANIVMISGCMDTQTSADAYNVNDRRKFSGACSSCLIKTLQRQEDPTVFTVLTELRNELRTKGFTQFPMVTSSREIAEDTKFF